jgi:hypothetical protein
VLRPQSRGKLGTGHFVFKRQDCVAARPFRIFDAVHTGVIGKRDNVQNFVVLVVAVAAARGNSTGTDGGLGKDATKWIDLVGNPSLQVVHVKFIHASAAAAMQTPRDIGPPDSPHRRRSNVQ